jgi:hypothetical protein
VAAGVTYHLLDADERKFSTLRQKLLSAPPMLKSPSCEYLREQNGRRGGNVSSEFARTGRTGGTGSSERMWVTEHVH